MAKSSKDNPWIYESPDHGTTVYRRKFGDATMKREEITYDVIDDYYTDLENSGMIAASEEEFQDEIRWLNLKSQAKDHPALQAALDHVIMIYTLSKEEDDNDEDLPF
jgi:hypothetical protein